MPRTSHPVYRIENGFRLIEINLREIRQLFNSLDPAPFHEQDLDAAAEEYIVGAVRELGLHEPNKLIVYLPQPACADVDAAGLPAAIQHYFAYRAAHVASELKQTLRFGAVSLAIGFAFLFLCLTLRQVSSVVISGAAAQIFAEGLLIVGWVALWRPLEVFLYEWWPIRYRQRLFDYLASMPVEVRARET